MEYIMPAFIIVTFLGAAIGGWIPVTCKTGDNEYKKHFLGLSDNVTYFVEQLDAANVSIYHYRVIFRPSVILPDINVETP